MKIRYAHTNIIATDWKKLVNFYQNVFNCIPVPPERNQKGEWLSKCTGVKNAALNGMHLRLPGHGDNGPTLEIYSYAEMENTPEVIAANRKGFGHIAFEVDNVEEIRRKVMNSGGKDLGEIVSKEVEGVGVITVTYMTDPEGNIIEIQKWA